MDKVSNVITTRTLEEESLLECSRIDGPDIEKPIQELFDNCLSFISVCDFLEM